MGEYIEVSAKTVDDAVTKALIQLGTHQRQAGLCG